LPVTIIDVSCCRFPSPRWNRPYRDPFKIIPAAIATIGTVFFAAVAIATAATMAKRTSHVPAFALPVVVVFGLVWLMFAWRMYRTALLVSDTGVRVRWLLLTRTFAWSQRRGFRHGAGGGSLRSAPTATATATEPFATTTTPSETLDRSGKSSESQDSALPVA
jgi:hypothetical protein